MQKYYWDDLQQICEVNRGTREIIDRNSALMNKSNDTATPYGPFY